MSAWQSGFSDNEAQEWLNRQISRYQKWGFGLWAVILKETDEMIGQCGLTMQPWKDAEVLEIGYLFERSYWHHGYAIEAAKACKKYAFEVLKADGDIWRSVNIYIGIGIFRGGDIMRKWASLLSAIILLLCVSGCAQHESGEENDTVVGKTRLEESAQLMEFLKNEITDNMSLEQIVDVFERMCGIPVEDDLILFEAGTSVFTEEPVFFISFTRQFPNDVDDEFYQIHVDVQYQPNSENSAFNELKWDDELSENIFDYIRNSPVFSYAKDKEYIKIDIHLDET